MARVFITFRTKCTLLLLNWTIDSFHRTMEKKVNVPGFFKNFDFEFNVLFWHVFLLRSALCAHAKAAVVKLDAFSKLESVHSRLTGSIVVRDSNKTD